MSPSETTVHRDVPPDDLGDRRLLLETVHDRAGMDFRAMRIRRCVDELRARFPMLERKISPRCING